MNLRAPAYVTTMFSVDAGHRPTSWKEKAKITAGAVTALVIVGWIAFVAIAIMS